MMRASHIAMIAVATFATMTPAFAGKPLPKKTKVIEATTLPEETAANDLDAKLVVDPNLNSKPVAMEASATLPLETMEAPAAVPAAVPVSALPKADVNKLPENQIPVLANTKETKKAEGGTLYRLMATLGVLAALLGAATFGLKRWMKTSGQNKENTRIKMLTQHHLGPKKSLAIIQVAGESLLIGVTDHNISMLKTLSLLDDEIPEAVPTNFNNAMADFDDESEEANTPAIDADAGSDEEFTISGLAEIRDKVSTRMKSMRRF